MASALKQKVIGGAWAAACGIAAYKTYRSGVDFEERTPCLAKALEKLSASLAARDAIGHGELQVAFWNRKQHIDEVAGRARASFKVRGENGSAWVFMSAQRGASAQLAFEAALEEEEEELSGFRYYWSRPWEIKRLVIDSATRLVGKREAVQNRNSSSDEAPDWELDALFFLAGDDVTNPSVLQGDVRGIPEFEALCVRDDSATKDDRSRRRLWFFLGTLTTVSVFAGATRLIRSMGVSKTYGYVRRTVLAHPAVVEALGPSASISTSSGTFKPSYLNARLRLVGDRGAVADIDFAATKAQTAKDGEGGPWRVAVARMSWAGKKQNLSKAYF